MVSYKLLALAAPIIGAAMPMSHPPGKRGLASNDGLDLSGFENTPAVGQSKVRWQYNWDSDIAGSKLSLAEYVPMLHSLHDGHEVVWADRVNKWLGQGTGHLLAFNEPEQRLQAAMSVGEAVQAWWKYMEPYAGRARLGAPAVSNDGWGWITQFLNECQGCHIDFVPIHWYNPTWLEHDFETWVNRICSLGRPVWITEVRCTKTHVDVKHATTDDTQNSLKAMAARPMTTLSSCKRPWHSSKATGVSNATRTLARRTTTNLFCPTKATVSLRSATTTLRTKYND